MWEELRNININIQTPLSNSLQSQPTLSQQQENHKTVRAWYANNTTAYAPLAGDSVIERGKWVPGWPLTPAALRKSGRVYFVRFICDIIAIAATLPFLVLAVYAMYKNGSLVDEDEWEKLQYATKMVGGFVLIEELLMRFGQRVANNRPISNAISRPSRHFQSSSQRLWAG